MDRENNPMELTGSEEAPEETPIVETPVEETPSTEESIEEVPVDPEPEEVTTEEVLYETPDGRKVTADVLQKEWKENFLPEFTRKSQRLAEIDREKELNRSPKEEPAWKDPNYVPQNYAEVIEIAKAAAIDQIQNDAKSEQNRIASIKKSVETELSGLKTKDPSLDENSLFQHANKYGFQSLTTTYANMKDMKKTAVDVEQRTIKNLKTRDVDPVSTGAGGEASDDSGYDPNEMSQYDGAAEYLSHLKGKK